MSINQDANRVYPVDALSTGEQEARFLEANKVLRNEPQNIPSNIIGSGNLGCQPLLRIKLTLESGIEEEIKFILNQLVMQSNQNPSKISLKSEYAFLPDYLLNYLESDATSIDSKIDCLLIIRNIIQSIDNCQIFSMNIKLREILIDVLNLYTNEDGTLNFFDKEQVQEMVKFSLDIIENISSYLSPVSKDDEIFNKLLEIFNSNENKYISITILRSIARYLYNSSTATSDASVLIDDAFLNKTVGFLLLSINEYDIDDEIILTSLDFLIQYLSIKESNMSHLIADFNRRSTLEKLLPKLLAYKQNYKTEYDQKQFLRIYKRQQDKLNTEIATLDKESKLYKQLNAMTEPSRAHAWMRCCFKPNKNGSITQIEFWRAYEAEFDKESQLAAVVFIRNVQSAFPKSFAKVVTVDGERKFIIQGIEPRVEPVDVETGKQAALKGGDESEYFRTDLKQSEQAKTELFNYGFNDYLKLNDINQSTVSLIKHMIAYDSGLALLKSHKSQLLDIGIFVPDLLPSITDIIEILGV